MVTVGDSLGFKECNNHSSRKARRKNWGCTSPSASSQSLRIDGANKHGNHVKHIKGKKMIGGCWHRFIKGKSRLTNLTAFYNEVAA